jgi:hypothetical protein
MRRVELLIDTARKLSGNTRYDSQSGIPQDVFVQFLNNAQDSLIMEVQNLKTKYFKKQTVVTVVPGQEIYPYPEDCYMQHIDTVKWTDSSTGTYWTNLYKTTTKEKITLQPGYPFAYIPHEDGIYMNPPINSGQLYITYVRTPKRLQKRGGKVSARTIVGTSLTALTVDPAEASFDQNEINTQNYLCVVDKFGVVKSSNVLYDSCNSSGVFTLSSFDLGTTTISVGDYILVGEDCSNKPTWEDDIVEGYLLKHMVYEAKYGDSSAWTDAAIKDMAAYFQKLSGSFATLSDDRADIVISNLDYIGW